MGCSSSITTAVLPMEPGEVEGDGNETASKVDGRGDSAVSKDTTDSGVVMDVLPGAVPRKLPPLTSQCVSESNTDRITQDGLLQQQQGSSVEQRPWSRDILEELQSQGIIPLGQTPVGEAYSIMLDDEEGFRRRPPARLESLKSKKTPSKEEIEEKMRLAEERRKLREDTLKTRLRTQSARVRGPAPTSTTEEDKDEDKDEALTLVEPLHLPLTPDPLEPAPHSQMRREAAEGAEWVREAGGDSRENTGRTNETAGRSRAGVGDRGDNRGSGMDSDGTEEEEEEEEELTQVEEFQEDQPLTALKESENDSSFKPAEDE